MDNSYDKIILDYIDLLIENSKYENIYILYNKITSIAKNNKNVRSYINNKNVNKSQQKEYYCHNCNETYKYSYKYLHLKSNKHLLNTKNNE